MITDDNLYENEERFILRLAELPGFALPDNFVLGPNMSEINIRDDESELSLPTLTHTDTVHFDN